MKEAAPCVSLASCIDAVMCSLAIQDEFPCGCIEFCLPLLPAVLLLFGSRELTDNLGFAEFCPPGPDAESLRCPKASQAPDAPMEWEILTRELSADQG